MLVSININTWTKNRFKSIHFDTAKLFSHPPHAVKHMPQYIYECYYSCIYSQFRFCTPRVLYVNASQFPWIQWECNCTPSGVTRQNHINADNLEGMYKCTRQLVQYGPLLMYRLQYKKSARSKGCGGGGGRNKHNQWKQCAGLRGKPLAALSKSQGHEVYQIFHEGLQAWLWMLRYAGKIK